MPNKQFRTSAPTPPPPSRGIINLSPNVSTKQSQISFKDPPQPMKGIGTKDQTFFKKPLPRKSSVNKENKESMYTRFMNRIFRREEEPEPEEEYYKTLIPVAVDGGYGWVIVAITFIGVLIVDGIAYSFFILRPGLIQDGLTESNCALCIATVNCLTMLVAPISSSLCNVLGFRLIMMTGSIIASLCLLVAHYTYGFIEFYITFGVVAGFGFGLMYLPMTIPAGLWFDATRPLAVGVASCGTGIGMIVIPFLLQSCLDFIHYRALYFVVAGLMSINVFTALFLLPVPMVEIEITKRKQAAAVISAKKGVTALEYIGASEYQLHEKTTSALTHSSHRILKNERGYSKIFRRNTTSPVRVRRLEGPSLVTMHDENEGCCRSCFHHCCCCGCCSDDCTACDGSAWFLPEGHRPIYKADVFYQGSIFRFNKELEKQKVDTAIRYSMHFTRLPTKKDVEEQAECKLCCPESLVNALQNMSNVKLLMKPCFLIYCASAFCFYTVATIPILYLNSFIIQTFSDDPPYVEWLIPSMGIGVFIGRLGGGILLQLVPTISALSLCSGLGFIISIATCVQPLIIIYPLFFVYSVVFGICFGSYATLRNLILVDYVGMDNLTSATGILLATGGISSMLGPPTSIALTKEGKNMEMAFYFSAAMFSASTLLLLPLFFMKKHVL